MPAPRFRFGRFLISPAHRTLRRDDEDVPMIPRYFDLLVLLLDERHRVVTRQEIFDRVWTDVVVSDGALSQAIRTIRRTLGDDPREPRFIRTVSRHGYQFVAVDVCEEQDDGPMLRAVRLQAHAVAIESGWRSGEAAEPAGASLPAPLEDAELHDGAASGTARTDALLAKLLRQPPFGAATDEERREAAEQLHALGTAEALRRLDAQHGHAEARAMLRDARWDVPGAGDVPLIGTPDAWRAIAYLVRLRLRSAAREASNRWGTAALGGTAAGALAGLAGGVALWLVPQSQGGPHVVVALALVGALAGALGASGVGAGLAAAEVLARSRRALALTVSGALGGALIGAITHAVTRAVLSGVFGRDLSNISGWFEGLVLGAAAGIGYASSTSLLPGGGLAGPRGAARARTAIVTGFVVGVAAVGLSLMGRPLVASSLDGMAAAFEGSDVGLAPLARLLGEEDLRPMTRTLVGAFEGLLFGIGLSFGLTHRPKR